MAASSGSLGGDDSSKLEALAKSIAENSEKLEILNKILGNIEDAGSDDKKKEPLSTTDFLKNIEKIVSKSDLEKARSESKKMQVDADRLASNTFRASETVLSEVLSRLGGTSFYPVLSAFRVARESVSTATGTPQSELKVNDIIQFVNDSTTTLLTNIFTKFEFGIHTVEDTVLDLNAILEQTKQDLVDIKQALMPLTTGIKQELENLSKLDPNTGDLESVSLDDIPKYAEYILALQETGQATQEHIELLNQLDALYKETGTSLRDVIDQERKKRLIENLEDEKSRLRTEGPELQQRLDEERRTQSEIQREAMDAARTVAGIAGALIPIGFVLSDVKDITKSVGNLLSSVANETIGSFTKPSGGDILKGSANIVQNATNVGSSVSSLVGTVIGSSIKALGPTLGGPIGSFAGKAIADTILAPINIAAQALVSINEAVYQIADDLVGFSPDITGAVIGREIAVLRDDFRRASQIGPQVARITEAQTRLQLASRQAFDNFLITAEPILINILNELTVFVQTVPALIGSLTQGLAQIIPGINILNANTFGMKSDLGEIVRKMGTEDPLEIASLANQGGMQFFANNPHAAVRLK